jgi:hypothetical protein
MFAAESAAVLKGGSVSYFILRNGQQYGPYSPADIERYLTVGGIVVTDLARTEEMNQWLPLSNIIHNTLPPPTAVETLNSGCGSSQQPASAGPEPGESSLKVQPMPPPDHVPYPAPHKSRAHRFSKRIRHLLDQLQFGLNRSHRPHP